MYIDGKIFQPLMLKPQTTAHTLFDETVYHTTSASPHNSDNMCKALVNWRFSEAWILTFQLYLVTKLIELSLPSCVLSK